MKKKYIVVFVIILTAVITLIRNMDSKHITFPFAESDIVQVEVYHYEGVPILSSKAGSFEYRTFADLDKYWKPWILMKHLSFRWISH